MIHQHGFNFVGSKESVKIAASACHGDTMAQFNLSAGEVDSSVDMPIQALGMIQQLQNAHRQILSHPKSWMIGMDRLLQASLDF
jgi:hypothetical protein